MSSIRVLVAGGNGVLGRLPDSRLHAIRTVLHTNMLRHLGPVVGTVADASAVLREASRAQRR
jgi:hypothetical protein